MPMRVQAYKSQASMSKTATGMKPLIVDINLWLQESLIGVPSWKSDGGCGNKVVKDLGAKIALRIVWPRLAKRRSSCLGVQAISTVRSNDTATHEIPTTCQL